MSNTAHLMVMVEYGHHHNHCIQGITGLKWTQNTEDVRGWVKAKAIYTSKRNETQILLTLTLKKMLIF